MTGTREHIADYVEHQGHALTWHSEGALLVATCQHKDCAGRLRKEGDSDQWSGLLLWLPCPIIIAPTGITEEQALAIVYEDYPQGH